MSEPVTIWVRLTDQETCGVFYREPQRASGVLAESQVDWLRRAKHLTDAELAAEHFSWLFLASHTAFENDGWNREADEHSKRAQVIRRFATHEQAV